MSVAVSGNLLVLGELDTRSFRRSAALYRVFTE
jgi:hypothetical protein